MKEKRNVLIILIIVISVIVLVNLLSSKYTKEEIMKIADDSDYQIKDTELLEKENDLSKYENIFVSPRSAASKNDADEIAMIFENCVTKSMEKDNSRFPEDVYSEFAFNDINETDKYYIYSGEYTYTHGSNPKQIVANRSLFIFKSDYFEYPYLRDASSKEKVKEFGDLIAVINPFKDLVKSRVEEDNGSYKYTIEFVDKSYYSPAPSQDGSSASVVKGQVYSYNEGSFNIDKESGKIEMNNIEDYLDNDEIYRRSFYDGMDIVVIRTFEKEN